MTFGFAPSPATDPVSRLGRMLEPAEWTAAGIPLLRDPREIVTGLYERHRPRPATTVIAVLGPDERLAASASFSQHPAHPDGWEFRNALLGQLRRVIPHDLRRRVPVRTAVLLCCRLGQHGWTPVDGAWMWGLRDACTLHGLRCGAYITLTSTGWQVLGEERGGRRPSALTATATATATTTATATATERSSSSAVDPIAASTTSPGTERGADAPGLLPASAAASVPAPRATPVPEQDTAAHAPGGPSAGHGSPAHGTTAAHGPAAAGPSKAAPQPTTRANDSGTRQRQSTAGAR